MASRKPIVETGLRGRTRRDAELAEGIGERIPRLIDAKGKRGGNPWGIKFFTMFHQTNDAEHFQPARVWEEQGYELEGNLYGKPSDLVLPLYEAPMVQAFDHRAASVLAGEAKRGRRGEKFQAAGVRREDPAFCPLPRWWVDEKVVARRTRTFIREWFLAYKDVADAAEQRTIVAAFLPWSAVADSLPLIVCGDRIGPRLEACLLANLNSLVCDYVARQQAGGKQLSFSIVEQLPTLRPDIYGGQCPWARKETLEQWISERVLKLTCTDADMFSLANASGFQGCGVKGSRGKSVQVWNDAERAELRAELDAAYFRLYGIEREEVAYILSTFGTTGVAGAVLEAYDRLAPIPR